MTKVRVSALVALGSRWSACRTSRRLLAAEAPSRPAAARREASTTAWAAPMRSPPWSTTSSSACSSMTP